MDMAQSRAGERPGPLKPRPFGNQGLYRTARGSRTATAACRCAALSMPGLVCPAAVAVSVQEVAGGPAHSGSQ